MHLRTLRSFQTTPPLSTASERPLPNPSGRPAANTAPEPSQPDTAAQPSTVDVRPGLQQEVEFEVQSLHFQKPLTDPLAENEAEATGVMGDMLQKGADRVRDGIKALDPCNNPESLQNKAKRCSETPTFKKIQNPDKAPRSDQMGFHDFLSSSPSELQQIFQDTSYPPQIRTQSMLVYSQKMGLLSESTARSLFDHPYTQRLGAAKPGNAAERADFQRQLKIAFQPSQAMFERLSGTLGHFTKASFNRTTQNVDQGLAAAGQALERGYPTLGELQTLLKTVDIEPLKMLSQAVKDTGYGQLDQLYQQYAHNPAIMAALPFADAAATSFLDVVVPANLIDLAGKYSKFIELDSMKALSGTARTTAHGTGSASSMVIEPVSTSKLEEVAKAVIKHPSKEFEQSAFRLRWSYQQRVDQVIEKARAGQLPKAEAKRKVQDLQSQFVQQFQALSTRNMANELLIGKFLLSSPIWSTWDLNK